MSVSSVVQTIQAQYAPPAASGAAGSADSPFQLASAPSTAPSGGGSGTAPATNPYQSLASDLQSALLNLQSVGGDASGALGGTQQPGATHHGHHHHGGGGGGGVQADAPSLPGASRPQPAAA